MAFRTEDILEEFVSAAETYRGSRMDADTYLHSRYNLKVVADRERQKRWYRLNKTRKLESSRQRYASDPAIRERLRLYISTPAGKAARARYEASDKFRAQRERMWKRRNEVRKAAREARRARLGLPLGNQKITTATMNRIVELRRRGFTYEYIQTNVGVTHTTVNRVLKRLSPELVGNRKKYYRPNRKL